MNFSVKNVSQTLTLLGSLAAFSSQAEIIYERVGGVGEYPAAFQMTKKATLMGYRGPLMELGPDVKCTLDVGHKLNFATGTSIAKTVQTGLVEAQADCQLDAALPGSGAELVLNIKAKDLIKVLTYYAEGFCLFEHNGTEYEGFCPGNSQADDFLEKREMIIQEWVWASCKENNAWFPLDYLISQEEKGNLKGINPWGDDHR